MIEPTLTLERGILRGDDADLVIGCDEVGRGALAGPVAVGASALTRAAAGRDAPAGVRDSKLVPPARRAALAAAGDAWSTRTALGWASASEVDEHGILPALALAAERALAELRAHGLDLSRAIVLLDGNHDYVTRHRPAALAGGARVRTVVKGDRDCASIAAASLVAKVARDALMVGLDDDYPAYGWSRNKGYASAEHRDALGAHGLSPHHRASWSLTAAAEASVLF